MAKIILPSLGDTSHGTGTGQILVDGALVARYGLTRREAECAALLRHGTAPKACGGQLGISASTLDKHLQRLREKLGVATTRDLVLALRAFEGDAPDSQPHSWPPPPIFDMGAPPGHDLIDRFRGNLQMAGMLSALRDALPPPLSVRYVFHAFAPLAGASVLRLDLLKSASAPEEVRARYAEMNVLEVPLALELLATPQSLLLLDGRSPDYEAAPPAVQRFYDVCLQAGVRYGVFLGFPAGVSWVGMALGLSDDASDVEALLRQHGAEIRRSAMAMHSCAVSYGALAAAYGLSLRERDALSALAKGLSRAEAAASLRVSERLLGDFLLSARTKLAAATNTEAVAKAMAANIPVFQ